MKYLRKKMKYFRKIFYIFAENGILSLKTGFVQNLEDLSIRSNIQNMQCIFFAILVENEELLLKIFKHLQIIKDFFTEQDSFVKNENFEKKIKDFCRKLRIIFENVFVKI